MNTEVAGNWIIRMRNTVRRFSFLRRSASNPFRVNTSRSISLPRKFKLAAYASNCFAGALQLREIQY
jgi:hypothetical protein